jgi:N-methylhydantoinase A
MDVGRNYARSYITRAKDLDVDRVNGLYRDMEREAHDGFVALGVDPTTITFSRTADLRYLGQFHEVEVAVPAGELTASDVAAAIDGFHAKHEQLYTFNMPWQQVELLTFRLRATTPRAPFEMRRIGAGGADASGALKRHRIAHWDGTPTETPVYDGALLRAGNEFHGPALIEETTTTVVVPPRYGLRVDDYRNYVLTRDGAGHPEAARLVAETTLVGGAA